MNPPEGRSAVAAAPTTAAAPETAEAGGAGIFRHLGRNLMVPVGLAILVLVGLALVSDGRELAAHLAGFDARLLVPVLALSLGNYALRFLRWEIYLRSLGVRLALHRSAAVMLVGFVLSVTPGNAGELGKAWLVRELGGGPALRVVPAVLAERVTDLLGIVLLIALGASAVPGGPWIAAGAVASTVAVVSLLTWRRGADAVLGLLARSRFLAARLARLEALLADLRSLLTARRLLLGLALSIAAWGAEGLGFLIVVRHYAADVSAPLAVFDYAVSTLVGALSMIPGGLIASEGSLAGLLGLQGLTAGGAVSATLIIRAATLWFAVALGLVALPWVVRRTRPTAAAPGPSRRRRDATAAAALALLVASLYLVTGPGHIDIIDGQMRFEVARNLIDEGRPVLRDPAYGGLPGRDGNVYSGYGPAASVAGMPLVWLGKTLGDPFGATSMFFFTFTSGIFGGLLAGVLFLAYRHLGVDRRPAAGWSLAAAFATLLWPLATSTFDQVQHAFFVLSMVLLASLSAERRSAALALLAGLAAAILLLYQEALGLLVPLAGFALWRVGDPDRRGGRFPSRYALFLLAAALGAVAWAAYNYSRFGHPLFSGKLGAGGPPIPIFGNPVVGLTSLLVSPGKGILLFSPLVVLAVLGARGLARRRPGMARCAAAMCAAWLLLVSCLAFFGGDWSWGPRYLVVVLPLWALAFPFSVDGRWRRRLAAVLIATGLAVQLLAVSVDHQRFFFARRLSPYFWLDRWAYFSQSQLFDRPYELVEVARPGVPATARELSPVPFRYPPTYTPHGMAGPGRPGAERYAIFHLPRPWPLWMRWAERRVPLPVPFRTVLLILTFTCAAGGVLLARSLRDDPGAATGAEGSP